MASARRQSVVGNYVDPNLFFKPRKDGMRRDQFQPETGSVYQKLRPEVIYSLLNRAGKMHLTSVSRNVVSARSLLERMSNEEWTCTATAHEGGKGDASRRPDPYLHFNVNFQADPTAYHVRCHELQLGGLLVFQVTF
jgi:hypothetical protein